jgi:hypothetical protein
MSATDSRLAWPFARLTRPVKPATLAHLDIPPSGTCSIYYDAYTSRARLVDYYRRRTALHDWFLDETTWHQLTSQLPPTPGPVQPVLDDRKRQDASVFVWTRVTQGEHLFAPRPIETRQPPPIQDNWARRRNTAWFQLTRPDPMRHYADLRNLLIPYAQQLAASIDHRAQ